MKKIFIGANWKLHFDQEEIKNFFENFNITKVPEKELIIFPQAPLLSVVKTYCHAKKFSLGSQNSSVELQGAFTGESSPKALKSLGVEWGLVGHSERRSLFGETNESCLKKGKLLLAHHIRPILCVGEEKTIREQGFNAVTQLLESQLAAALSIWSENNLTDFPIVIAYEPVWSIGTGLTPTIEQVNETLSWITKFLHDRLPTVQKGHQTLALMYGGSVNKDNSRQFLDLPSCHGLLIGGASLKPYDLGNIYQS